MKKNQVNEKFVTDTVRKNKIISLVCLISVLFIISLSFCLIYFNNNKESYIKYDEDSSIDYKVYLKENEFFNNKYLESENQYIASLIDYIYSEFNYNLEFEKSSIDFNYSYRIEATVNVKENNSNKSLYTQTKTLLEKKNIFANSSNTLTINENVDIDYNTYNNLIRKFINIYGLDEINSYLLVNMYVDVESNCTDLDETNKNESVMTLNIPLTTKTVGIDISNNLVNSKDNIIICNDNNPFNIIFLVLSTLTAVTTLGLVIYLLKYIDKTRSADSKYEIELKKILYNYHSYIQEVNNTIDLSQYQLIDVKTFNDMLEIRDTENKPILMTGNKEKRTTYFFIPTNTNLLYIYRLKINNDK